MKSKFINYLFDKETYENHKLYANVMYYGIITGAIMMFFMSIL